MVQSSAIKWLILVHACMFVEVLPKSSNHSIFACPTQCLSTSSSPWSLWFNSKTFICVRIIALWNPDHSQLWSIPVSSVIFMGRVYHFNSGWQMNGTALYCSNYQVSQNKTIWCLRHVYNSFQAHGSSKEHCEDIMFYIPYSTLFSMGYNSVIFMGRVYHFNGSWQINNTALYCENSSGVSVQNNLMLRYIYNA